MSVQLPEFRLVDAAMRKYCQHRGAALLRVLQDARGGADACRAVFLALDADGIVKVFKEVLPHKDPAAGVEDTEAALLARLRVTQYFPRHYGVEEYGGVSILRQSVEYGQNLQAWIDARVRFGPRQIRSIVGRLAEALAFMHANGVLHLDVRPANVRIDGRGLSLIDLGDSRSFEGGDAVIKATPSDPFFAPPETVEQGIASSASDLYQLGGVGRLLLAETSPFDDVGLTCAIGMLLDPNPAGRPSAAEVAREFGTEALRMRAPSGSRRTSADVGTVLFPARMGIPHQGHVDFIARVMELGFPVIISLQRSYTITDRDPLPKWQVMKMVAASLVDKGFVPDEDFSFVFTPFFDTDEAHKLHFAMMPGMDRVVAVASNNPSVHALFPDLPFIDQRAVFGHEGEAYLVRSWGERLRSAVRSDDRATFDSLAASGVERIVSLEEMRCAFRHPPVEFISGTVTVSVLDEQGKMLVRGRSFRYLAPQQSAVRHLAAAGHDVRIDDLYAADTQVTVDGNALVLRDANTVFDENGNADVRFLLMKAVSKEESSL